MKKKLSGILRKCKSLSAGLGRSSSYSSLRSKSTREEEEGEEHVVAAGEVAAVVFVGSSRRRYTINPKHLSHPLLNALIERSKCYAADHENISVKCEVVLFDHLLWMLENADLEDVAADGSLEELANLYVY